MAGDDDILRIAAQFDVGTITAGIDEAASAVKSGTTRMNDSFTSLAAAQIRVASANKDLRETLAGTVSKGLTPTTAATEEVAAAMYEAKVASDAFKSAQEDAYGASQKLTSGVNNSRIAFTGLTQDMGIRGSRVLASFLAQSETLGPILSKAFAAVAIVAFVEFLDQANKKLAEITDSMAGFGKAAQKAYKEALDANQSAIVSTIELNKQIRDIATIGTEGAEKYAIQQKNSAQTLKEMVAANIGANVQLQRQTDLMQHLQNAADFWHDPLFGLTGATRALKEGTETLERYQKTVDELTPKIKSQLFVQQPTDKATEKDRGIKEQEKYTETLAKFYDEDVQHMVSEAREERHVVDQRIAEQKRLAEEMERNEEAMAKLSEEILKKDTETFQRSLTERIHMQEEAGRNEIEQIKAQAEAQSKATQSTSMIGGADPRLIEIADKSLDEQAFKIMDLIGLEEQLRVTLQQTGIAESDPKILESLSRQQQMVQQLTVAMQKYDQAVQKVGQAELKDFQKNFEQITSSLNRGVISWIDGTEKFGRAMMQVWTGIVNSAIQATLKMGEQWLLTHLEMAIIGKATGTSAAASQIGAAAGEAFANTYAAISAIPIVGPALAPGMAAASASAALSGGMAFLAFEHGGIMGGSESLALLHPREMVLPSHISESVQQMAAGGAGAGAGGGHIHVHNHFAGTPSTTDMEKMEAQMVAVVKRARRRGRF